ncbi:uncharacterized protein LOC132716225 [Ruditapes philippinarum]|uniref:uncharacterized protein LOC132716225 n=1 Tax=Ruditapes philippinarum TaxID=129788 RepID=UPI00295AFD33|nr:uncharacterized protein LOC132716225 [Ruditapes philippinarum]
MNAHHRSQCPKRFSQIENVTHLANNIQMSDESQEVKENGLREMNKVIFMQTASTEIQNPVTMENSQVRILFDSGSHRSYMSETLAQKMNLKVFGKQDIHESTFGRSMDKSLQTTKIAMDDLWNIEAIGMTDKQVDTDDEIAMKKFRETIQYKDKRYFVTWPWKNEEPDIPLNRELAVGRLRSTVNRMKNKPELMQKYDNVIQEQFTKGIIERVETKRVGIVHYLPHHAVITPQKTTTKLRVVYDASSKSKQSNKSLNECLYRGPVMLHDLCGMLMRFRLHKIALVADIEKAFLQIGL